jgi:hypothetical protein
MLNLKGCLYHRYDSRIERMTPAAQERLRATYDEMNDFLSCAAVLVYGVYAEKAKKLSCDMGEVLGYIEIQMGRFNDMDGKQMVEAMFAIDAYNNMNRGIMRYKRENPEVSLPYITFDPCPWYFDAVRLLKVLNKEDYPLVKDWQEFFMFLPLQISDSRGDEQQGQVRMKMSDYVRAAQRGEINKWYADTYFYGHGGAFSDKSSFRELYIGEMASLSDTELQAESLKGNWGHRFVREEIERRKVPKVSSNA